MKAQHHNRNWHRHLQNSEVNQRTETVPSRWFYNWNQVEKLHDMTFEKQTLGSWMGL